MRRKASGSKGYLIFKPWIRKRKRLQVTGGELKTSDIPSSLCSYFEKDKLRTNREMKKLRDVRVGILKIPVTRIMLLIISDMLAILLASVLSLYVRPP